jgi:hypothetical protein
MSNSESDLPPRIYRPLPILENREQVEALLSCGSIEELSGDLQTALVRCLKDFL